MTENLHDLCKQLRLAYVVEVVDSIEFLPSEYYLSNVLVKEIEMREFAKVERNLKKARFLENKTLESYQWGSASLKLPQTVTLEQLEELEFIKAHQNLVLVGAPGTGKTYLATALGRLACEKGYQVRFYRVSHLVEELETTYRNGKLSAFQKRFDDIQLLILDEMGYVLFSKEVAGILFQLITEFYEKKSLIVISNLEFSQWNRTTTYTGESYRLTNALSRIN